MMTPGSGHASPTASAVESLFAARLMSDAVGARAALKQLSTEYARGECGIQPSVLDSWLTNVAARSGLSPTKVSHQPGEGLGDLLLLNGKTKCFVEIKAQTRKTTFSQLVQADWVRDYTDAIAYLTRSDASFRALLPSQARSDITTAARPGIPRWVLDTFVISDIAGLTTGTSKTLAGVRTVADLRRFVHQKYLLHVTQQGAAFIPFNCLEPVRLWLAGAPMRHVVSPGKTVAAKVKVAFGRTPGPSQSHFTYYVGYPSGVLGRHKLHGASLPMPKANCAGVTVLP